jgi:50S ribosomal subunit-associated GTPase HflX
VTSRPILVILNKVDLLRGDFAVGQQKEEVEVETTAPVSTYDGNNVRTPEAKLSFKKRLLQRKRDALLDVDQNSADSLETPATAALDADADDLRANAGGDESPVKSVINTDYSEYKDEFNELESENVRYSKPLISNICDPF